MHVGLILLVFALILFGLQIDWNNYFAYEKDKTMSTSSKIKVYLAGPMRGIPEFNFPAFRKYAALLREEGYDVFSPAERDNDRHGTDISKGNATGDEKLAEKEHGFDLRVALAEDLTYICRQADAVALMPMWESSKGAIAEKATATALGLKIIYLEALYG